MARRRQAFGASLTGADATNGPSTTTEGSNPAPAPAPAPGGRQAKNNQPREGNKQQQPHNRNGGNKEGKKGRDASNVAAVEQGGPASKIAHPVDVDAAALAIENMSGPLAEPADGNDEQQQQQTAIQMPPAVSDEDTCFICAERIVYWSVGQCGHQTCHVCALRLRVFYKKTDCTFCKTELPSLALTSSSDTPFPSSDDPRTTYPVAACKSQEAVAGLEPLELERGQLDLRLFKYTDEKLSLVFESAEMMDATLLLLRFNCPDPSCEFMAAGWDGLEKHTLAVHKAVLCHLCRRQLSRFAHEQVLYPPHLLPLHDPSRLPRGHRKPRPRGKVEEDMVARWGEPHPMCEFCHEASFGPDELFKHMRTRHEECFVCSQAGQRDVYFQDYRNLEAHFHQAHFPCTEKECLEKKFVVFGSELDWRAHMVSEHHSTMSNRDKHAARVLPVSFVGPLSGDHSFIPPDPVLRRNQNGESSAGSSRVEGGAQFSTRHGRHRDRVGPHAQQLPQPAQDDRNARRAAFGAGLTPRDSDSEQPRSHGGAGGSGTRSPAEPVDEVTAARHADLLNRVAMMVDFSDSKMSSFKHAIRQFKQNEAPARDMINTFYSIFDRDTDTTLRMAREVSNLMQDDRDKVQSILEAVNTFKLERQAEFPTLGGPSGIGSGFSDVTSGRVLSAKSAAQYSSAANAVWDRVERAAASRPVSRPASSNTGPGGRKVPGATAAFPALGSAPVGPSRNAGPSATAWSGRIAQAPVAPVIRSINMPSSNTGRNIVPAKPSAGAFPSLPAASSSRITAQERRALFSNGNARDRTLERMQVGVNAPAADGWSTVNANGSYTPVSPPAEIDPPTKSSGKKKKKELLFTVSARPT